MEDIVEDLRATAGDTDAVENASVARLLENAADEIERLRPAYATAVQRLASEIARLRLTDAEREAVEWYASFPDGIHAATLRGLLDRTKTV